MKVSDEQLEDLDCLIGADDTLKFAAWKAARAELMALRKIAEAAKEYVLSGDADEPGWESDYDALRAALREAGYA